MDNFVIENGWQENIYIYYRLLYMTLAYSMQTTYNTLQVVVYPTNDCYML